MATFAINKYQEHAGLVVTSGTPSLEVQYGYTLMSGPVNNSNPTGMTYPNGRVLDYVYNSGLDTTISRISGMKDDYTGTHVEDYSYLGLGTIVQRAHVEPGPSGHTGLNLSYIQQSGDTSYIGYSGSGGGGDEYTGLDRFGRVIDAFWTEPNTSPGATTTDRFQYAYDRDGDALYKNNLAISGLSELYHANAAASGDNASAYDNLSRVDGFIRGALSVSASHYSGSSGQGSLDTVSTASGLSNHPESWSLDALGNWSSQTVDGGSAVSRTHNSGNEVTAITGLTSPTFDYNGNTTKDQAGNTYVYDAWNRMISVTSSGSTLLATYVYDAKGWRVRETHSGTTKDIYFDHNWQNIEEPQSSAVTNQYVWSQAYIDGMVLRDDNSTSGNLGISGSGLGRRMYAQQDANWNTTALVDTGGTVQERFVYDPYGNAAVLTSGGSSTTDSYNWIYLHQGGRIDAVTGNYIFRHRDYSSMLRRWEEQESHDSQYNDGANFYQYLKSGPVDELDPKGLSAMAMASKRTMGDCQQIYNTEMGAAYQRLTNCMKGAVKPTNLAKCTLGCLPAYIWGATGYKTCLKLCAGCSSAATILNAGSCAEMYQSEADSINLALKNCQDSAIKPKKVRYEYEH